MGAWELLYKKEKEITGATDGNLSIHLSKMEENGYIEVYKDFFNKKPRTRYNLTVKGKDEFINYVNTLEKIIKQYQSSMGMVQWFKKQTTEKRIIEALPIIYKTNNWYFPRFVVN